MPPTREPSSDKIVEAKFQQPDPGPLTVLWGPVPTATPPLDLVLGGWEAAVVGSGGVVWGHEHVPLWGFWASSLSSGDTWEPPQGDAAALAPQACSRWAGLAGASSRVLSTPRAGVSASAGSGLSIVFACTEPVPESPPSPNRREAPHPPFLLWLNCTTSPSWTLETEKPVH